jgi:hypothetical protein
MVAAVRYSEHWLLRCPRVVVGAGARAGVWDDGQACGMTGRR